MYETTFHMDTANWHVSCIGVCMFLNRSKSDHPERGLRQQLRRGPKSSKSGGFTLIEVVMSSSLAAMSMAGIIYGYIQSAKFAEFTCYSLAAQSMAMQRVEQSRASKWDPLGYPAVDDLVSTNFPNQVNILDIPISGTNIVYATNFTTITILSTNPPLKMIRVDCVWPFLGRGIFTNTTLTYRAPDQ